MISINNKENSSEISKTLRVMIQGGPFSGKTTLFQQLKRRVFENSPVAVAFIDEAATYIMNETEYSPKIDPTLFQELINMLYLQWLAEAEEQIAKTKMKYGLILQDRGSTDRFIYEHHSKLLPAEIDLHKYDYIFFLEGLAQPGLDEKTGNATRMESYEEIKRLEEKAFHFYSGNIENDRFIFVPKMGVDERCDFVITRLNEILGFKTFKLTYELTK